MSSLFVADSQVSVINNRRFNWRVGGRQAACIEQKNQVLIFLARAPCISSGGRSVLVLLSLNQKKTHAASPPPTHPPTRVRVFVRTGGDSRSRLLPRCYLSYACVLLLFGGQQDG